MKRGLAFIVALLAGIVVFAMTTPTTPPPSNPPAPVGQSNTTTSLRAQVGLTGGALPDGTPFMVRTRPPVDGDAVGVSGMIVLEIDGVPYAVGPMQLGFNTWWETSYEGGLFRTSAGGHFVQIDFYDHILEALGPGAEEVIRSSIRGSIERGYPVLEVDQPFRWAGDDETGGEMGVRFEVFEVRRGCSERAVACSPDHRVQVMPLEELYYPAPTWPDHVVVEVSSG